MKHKGNTFACHMRLLLFFFVFFCVCVYEMKL